ncbi:MAG: dipicolinate synthase subunit DpsA [Oscillospiraceae bacterium]
MKTFLIAGGDMRQTYLADILSKKYKVITLGFDRNIIKNKSVTIFDSIGQFNTKIDYILMPLPCSTDGIFLNTPFCRKSIPIESLVTIANEDTIIFGGGITPEIEEIFTSRGLKIFDFTKREEFNIYNAVATAEGAVQITLEELPETISKQNVLILGFGRIAKVLANILKNMGATVTISARKYSSLAWAEVYGYNTIHLSKLEPSLMGYTLIYNTIPSMVLDSSRLNLINKDCLMIDLSSRPGGIDFQYCNDKNLKVIWALSLPGKTSPVSAGRYIGIAVENILNDIEKE